VKFRKLLLVISWFFILIQICFQGYAPAFQDALVLWFLGMPLIAMGIVWLVCTGCYGNCFRTNEVRSDEDPETETEIRIRWIYLVNIGCLLAGVITFVSLISCIIVYPPSPKDFESAVAEGQRNWDRGAASAAAVLVVIDVIVQIVIWFDIRSLKRTVRLLLLLLAFVLTAIIGVTGGLAVISLYRLPLDAGEPYPDNRSVRASSLYSLCIFLVLDFSWLISAACRRCLRRMRKHLCPKSLCSQDRTQPPPAAVCGETLISPSSSPLRGSMGMFGFDLKPNDDSEFRPVEFRTPSHIDPI
jgi:hypothetical protein